VLTREEHLKITRQFRNAFPYGVTNYGTLSKARLLRVVRRIYRDHPQILKALGL